MSIGRMVEKAVRLVERGRIERISNDKYNVIGDHGTYTVSVSFDGRVSCTCPGFQSKGMCSHSAAVIILNDPSIYKAMKHRRKRHRTHIL